jgi:hypothetical protein
MDDMMHNAMMIEKGKRTHKSSRVLSGAVTSIPEGACQLIVLSLGMELPLLNILH